MSYIGNPIVSTDFPKDTFSGNGSTTAFTMSIAPASVNSVLVVVSGVTQDPSTYTISGTTLTFSAAPPSGTSNISVRHLGIAGIPNTPSTASVVTTSIADANVTPAKLSTGSPDWDSSGNFKFNSGYGSTTTAYGCRAWVNFDGTTSPGTIRGSGNVSSVTKNGTGDYTINFTNSMTDANYVGQISIGNVGSSDGVCGGYSNATRVAGSYRVRTLNSTQSSSKDFDTVYVSVFR